MTQTEPRPFAVLYDQGNTGDPNCDIAGVYPDYPTAWGKAWKVNSFGRRIVLASDHCLTRWERGSRPYRDAVAHDLRLADVERQVPVDQEYTLGTMHGQPCVFREWPHAAYVEFLGPSATVIVGGDADETAYSYAAGQWHGTADRSKALHIRSLAFGFQVF